MAKLPRGLRNNNPGNIEDGKFAQSLPGYVGSDGRFAVFDSMDAGAHAMQKLLSGYGRKGLNTVEGVINRWAPPTENDTGAYANTVARHLGVGASDKIDLNDPDTLAKLSSAMAGVENGRVIELAYVDPQGVAQPSADSAVAAVNAMGGAGNLAGVEPNPVQTAAYVPPPLSGQQGNFTPLLGATPQTAPSATQAQEAVPEPTVSQPEPIANDDDEVLKAWGLEAAEQPSDAAPASSADPDEGLIKAWGLDKTDAAPSAAMAAADEKAPTGRHLSFEEGAKLLDEEERMKGAGGAVGAALTGALDIPIAGPAILGATKKAAAGISSLINGESYDENLDTANRLVRTAGEQHPHVRTAGNIVGSVGATVPLIAAAPGLMGASGTAALGTNMLMGGASGAAIGGADAAVRSGGDLNAIRTGAELGGGFGLLGPAAGKAIGYGANKLMQAVSSVLPKGAAARNLQEAVNASDTSLADIGNQLQRNSRLTPMDVDPNLQQMAMNLANQGGAPRAVLNKAVEARMAGAKDAVTDTFDQALGQTPNVKLYLDTLKANTAANAKTAFGDALKNAKPVDVAPVLADIDAAVGQGTIIPQGPVEQALTRLRSKLANETETLTDAQRLHEVQSQLRIDADTLAKSSSGQDKLVANALRKARQKLIDQIDDASGSKYRPAQKQYADDMSINDAFDKGRQILAGGTSGDAALQNRPEYWDDWIKNASKPEIDAAKVGARVAIDQQINSVRNAAAKGAAIPEVGFSKERLEILLGKRETAKLAQTLADEQKIAQTNAKLFAGSQTAPRQAVNKLTEVTQVTPGISITTPMAGFGGYQFGGLPGAAAGVGLSLIGKGAQAGLRARDVVRNRLMAEALSGDIGALQNALAPSAMPGRVGAKLERGTNRLLSTIAPTSATQINQRRPLEITVTSKRK